ncbi:oxidoreductase [candidate division WOR-3 bacterium 4484_100]|uniref:Oxidoreductase n=1 Tax=candidate division WOR-3 bacterium 4484_100 TaxID=1936077 RepID=A0A1V4QGE4_UNCW3|nr:MAG: oxidoreductase [candidate division WOR-3 bacterium 4484_100]
MKLAVVGVGYWGPNLVRNFLNHPEVSEVYCCDIDRQRLDFIQKKYPSVKITNDYSSILQNQEIEGIVLATPVGTHFPLAKKALEFNKNVLVEKPLTANVDDARALIDLAEEKGLKLMVDHIFVYNGAVRKIKEIVDSGEIGDIMYFDAVRINLGLFQHDVNVIWDLATHDLSIMDYIISKKPNAVSAVGMGHYNALEDISYITLYYDNRCICHIHVNWLAPVKIRRILIGGTKKMIVFDDVEPVEKIKVYDKGVEVTTREGIYKTLIQYRTGDMTSPQYDTTEPLMSVVDEFIQSIKNNRRPLTDGWAGLKIVKIMEAAEYSIKNKGQIIELDV